MIQGTHRLGTTRQAQPREFADLQLGLGIERKAERFRVAGSLRVNLFQVLEDRIGLRKFF